MVLTRTPACEFGTPAPDFALPGTDEKLWTLQECRGEKGTLVMFICNHCPYVKAINHLLVRDVRDLLDYGIRAVGIMSNDISEYPDDSFENMKKTANKLDYPFPYLLDETQEVARAYGAVCTPDFFGYDAGLGLRYRGRLDSTSPSHHQSGARRELFEAMCMVADKGQGPEDQIPSMGCSVKWRS